MARYYSINKKRFYCGKIKNYGGGQGKNAKKALCLPYSKRTPLLRTTWGYWVVNLDKKGA